MLPTVPSRSMASSTLSRLCEGSPMPMKTTFLTARSVRARATWATISALPIWRSRPSLPGHAEHAAHGAAHLGGDAQAVARQQHALAGLAVLQAHQQALEPSEPGWAERSGPSPDFGHDVASSPSRTGLRQEVFKGGACRCLAARPETTGAARAARGWAWRRASRRRWRMCSMRMGKKDDERASVVRRPRARGGGQAYSRPP
jgi:hypothetical protein